MADTPITTRTKTGTFAKGVSGNPTGRPKKLAELEEAAQAHTLVALDTLARIAVGEKYPPAARVAASCALLDRGWGKARQAVEIAGANGGPVQMVGMTVEEFREAAREVADAV